MFLRARDYDPTTGTFTTRDPLDGVDGKTTVANPYHYVDNDPLNLTDPTGMRPSDKCLEAVGGDCDEVVKILERYLSGVWKTYSFKINPPGCAADQRGAGSPGTLCVFRIPESRFFDSSRLAQRLAPGGVDDFFEHIVLHEFGHVVNNEIGTLGTENAWGWPGLDGADEWTHIWAKGRAVEGTSPIFEKADAMRQGARFIQAERKTDSVATGIDELLADCIAESAKPDVSGGYWAKYVPFRLRCTPSGRRAAYYYIRRIRRDRTEFELCGFRCSDHVPVPK